jgi:hypothetical protein
MFRVCFVLTVFSFCSILPCTGCFLPVSAERLAGYYEPRAKASKNLLGASIELGTSFVGRAIYNADTGSYEVTVDSKPEPVLAGQAERATALEELRQIEATANVEIAKAWSQAMTTSIAALASALEKVNFAAVGGGNELPPEIADLLTPQNLALLQQLLLLQNSNGGENTPP